jgi:nucleotide-binding universal stress UspA family protein
MSTAAPVAEQQEAKIDFEHIVVATDFSPASTRALEYAIALARRYGAEISLVHAISSEQRERHHIEAEQEMGSLAEEARLKDLRHHVVLEYGSVWEVLSSVLAREKNPLLVLCTHGRGGLKKLALGSVAEEVLRLASCPVLTVGPNATPPRSGRADLKTILFATDFGPASAKAFAYALFVAAGSQSKLILLHTVSPMAVVDIGPAAYCPGTYAARELILLQAKLSDETLRKIRQLVPSNAKLPAEPECVIATDSQCEGILGEAVKYQAELIVMGANQVRSARLTAHLPGAITHDVLCKAKCPVLTVRN